MADCDETSAESSGENSDGDPSDSSVNDSTKKKYEDTDGPGRMVGEVKSCSQKFYNKEKDKAYLLNKGSRGKVYIFNIETSASRGQRHGTELDVNKLEDLFEKLKFDVSLYSNLTASGIRKHIKNIAKNKELKKCRLIVVCVLTHGYEEDHDGKKVSVIAGTDDQKITIEELLRPLTNENCPSLQGKPRVVLLQACRGDRWSKKKEYTDDGINLATHDFIIGYSTQQGCVSHRDHGEGSWFIHYIVQCFTELSHRLDVEVMMRHASIKMSEDMENEGKLEKEANREANRKNPKETKIIYKRKFQYPEIDCNLTKKLYFFHGVVEPSAAEEFDFTDSEESTSSYSTSEAAGGINADESTSMECDGGVQAASTSRKRKSNFSNEGRTSKVKKRTSGEQSNVTKQIAMGKGKANVIKNGVVGKGKANVTKNSAVGKGKANVTKNGAVGKGKANVTKNGAVGKGKANVTKNSAVGKGKANATKKRNKIPVKRLKNVKLKDLNKYENSRVTVCLILIKEPWETESSYQMRARDNECKVRLFTWNPEKMKMFEEDNKKYVAGNTYRFIGVLVEEPKNNFPAPKGYIDYSLRIDEKTTIVSSKSLPKK